MMLEYYFSKGFTILKCYDNILAKIPNDVKQMNQAEETDNSDNFMKCINKIPYTPNKLKNLVVNKGLHSPYNKT